MFYHNRAKAYSEIKKLDSALIDFNKSIKLNQKSKLSYLERGYLKKKMHDYKGAENDFSKHLEVNGNNFKGFLARGDIYIVLKSYNKAISDLSKAIDLDYNFFKFIRK